jgi:DNA-binding PadR family transcriptional regulator
MAMHGHHEHWGHGCGGRWAAGRFFGRGGGFGGYGRGPFGRGFGGPFGGRGSRMFDAGALRLVVLGLIAEEPRHGYDIIKALEARFHGAYSPSPGAIYPMLQMMEEADLVASQTSGNKRLYTITEAGRAYLKENQADLDRINEQLEEVSGDMQGAAVGDAFRKLRRSLHHRLRSGELSAEQARKVAEILKRAGEEIEGL